MGAFDDLLVELQGSGWYQKRIVYFMIGPIFFITPFAFLSQIFVLHIPGTVQSGFVNVSDVLKS
jgi:hypothetical protein